MENENQRKLDMLRKTIRFGTKICNYDVDFQIISVDDDFARLIGLTPEQKHLMVGQTARECVHPHDVSRITTEVYGFENKGTEYECQYRLKTAEGDYIWVKDIGEVITYNGKKCIRSVVVDINEREELIRQRDITYESVPGGVVFLVVGKDNFYIREANQFYFNMIGAEREEYIGSSGKYTFPEDLPGLREHLVTRAAKKKSVDYEFRSRREDNGKVCWYRILGNYYDAREEGAEYLCVMFEITPRKTAELELIKEKEKYRMAMQNTANLMYEYDVSEQRFRLFGQNFMTEDTSLCIDNDSYLNYKKLLFESDLLYRGDRRKIVSFLRNGEQCYDNVRLLTKNKLTGKKYYDNYEIYINKVYEKKKLKRVVGYIKKISYKTIPITVKQELHQMFDEHLVKDYSFILKIDVSTESFVSYFVDDIGWDEYRGNRYYDSFLYWWCKNMVAPEEQREIMFFLSLEQMLRILHSGEPRGYRFCNVKGRGGKYRHMICYFSFYGTDVNTIIFTLRDVDSVRAEESYQELANQRILNDALTEAKVAIETRKALMNYIVKEMSLPIDTAKQLLNEGNGEKSIAEIGKCIDYMGEMIGSIEEYNRLEAPRNRLGNKVNLYKLCREVCEEERKISLGLDISIDEHFALPENRFYYVHEFRFKEILINLLGNAIKYAPPGSQIGLYIKETRWENDRCNISITMEDEGPVINERFYERDVDYDNASDFRGKILAIGGVGYSLSLSSKITSLLGGTIEFHHGVVHNSIVQIDIPVQLSAAREELVNELALKTGETSDETELLGQGILLVEAESEGNKLTAPLLRVNGAKVYTAPSGSEAIRVLEEFDSGSISAILVDHELPDMNCYEFARKIKYTSNQNIRKIPVIEMLEGIQSDDTKMRLMSGINSSIRKPININKLTAMIENLQGKR